jgi:hypothetical protein
LWVWVSFYAPIGDLGTGNVATTSARIEPSAPERRFMRRELVKPPWAEEVDMFRAHRVAAIVGIVIAVSSPAVVYAGGPPAPRSGSTPLAAAPARQLAVAPARTPATPAPAAPGAGLTSPSSAPQAQVGTVKPAFGKLKVAIICSQLASPSMRRACMNDG